MDADNPETEFHITVTASTADFDEWVRSIRLLVSQIGFTLDGYLERQPKKYQERRQNDELMRQLAEARSERDHAVDAHRRVVANESNHYDRYWNPPDETISDEWLDETEAKMREALTDAFCDDAASIMLTLIAEIRRFRPSLMDSSEPSETARSSRRV